MRIVHVLAAFFPTLLVLSPLTASAGAVLTPDQAAARVRSAGYQLVSRSEENLGVWNIWASKDGIAYEVRMDAQSGSVIATIPVMAND